MSTLVAVKRNPVLKAFYVRLCAAGKAKESGPDGLYAQVADDPQRHGETSDPLATTGEVLSPKISNGPLTIRVVAMLTAKV